ncbi:MULTISPECIES: rubrerythrin family protein [unclassified Flavobacterium]|jgi:rubrerythrin|uniref:rubrerythrin family protein n=1 Tax=unclassified Flavobacterium TaxID=196869 RepID=UPI0025BC23C9|nr:MULTISPECIES: ferritin family protein [unclassified Flavobacterium]
MKTKLIIPALAIVSCLSIFSCKNKEENKSEMKTPVENKDANVKTEENTAVNVEDAKTKTIANLQAAFKGESNATARYAAFSKKAAEEGHKEIAMLFKAASNSEKIHAGNHKAVLEEMGVAIEPVVLDVTVKTTKENLEAAIKGESYEVAEMYPAFLKVANAAGNQLALVSFNYAYKTEIKHKAFYEKALAAFESNTDKTLPTTYFICPTCGNTYETSAPKRCGISMTSGAKFIKINSL